MAKKQRKSGKIVERKWPELEIYLLVWITEKRNNGLAILPSLVQLKALELAKDVNTTFLKVISRLKISGVNAS